MEGWQVKICAPKRVQECQCVSHWISFWFLSEQTPNWKSIYSPPIFFVNIQWYQLSYIQHLYQLRASRDNHLKYTQPVPLNGVKYTELMQILEALLTLLCTNYMLLFGKGDISHASHAYSMANALSITNNNKVCTTMDKWYHSDKRCHSVTTPSAFSLYR